MAVHLLDSRLHVRTARRTATPSLWRRWTQAMVAAHWAGSTPPPPEVTGAAPPTDR